MQTNTTSSIPLESGWFERLKVFLLRVLLYLLLRPVFGPPFPVKWQRIWIEMLGWLTPNARSVRITQRYAGQIPIEVVEPVKRTHAGVLLYLHGGAFIVGSPRTHRPLTTRLALETGACIWVPDYRLAPEHPYPAGLDDCLACYQSLLADHVPPSRILIGGDSAGGGLTLALALRIKALALPQPAGLLLLSPVTDTDMNTPSHVRFRHSDPMLRPGMMHLAMTAYALPTSGHSHLILQQDLSGLPPITVHVGEIEALLDDSIRLAEHARACGVEVRLEIYQHLYHVFHLMAPHLATARAAIKRLAARFTELASHR